MEYILTTFSCGDKTGDFKVPAFVPVEELIEVFNKLYNIEGTALHTEPRGIILDKSKTLAEQGVEHGALLTLG